MSTTINHFLVGSVLTRNSCRSRTGIKKIISSLAWAIFFGFIFVDNVLAQEIVINEFSSASSPEWVEIYNSSGSAIDLSGWLLKDEGGRTLQLSGCINSLGFRVFEQTDVSYWLNNPGDIISLINASGTMADTIKYGDKDETGIIPKPDSTQSVGRNPAGSDIWEKFDTPTFQNDNCEYLVTPTTTGNPTPTPVPIFNHNLLLSEIMPDPDGEDRESIPNGEWIEIFNPDKAELIGYVIKDAADNTITINSDNSEQYASGEYWVVYCDGSVLNNSGDSVKLMIGENVVDDMVYASAITGKSWSLINGDWCLSGASKGTINQNCWEENSTDDNEESPTATPTSMATAITPTLSPVITKILGASQSAEATSSTQSAYGFFDLFKSSGSASTSSAAAHASNWLKLVPWFFIGFGMIFLVVSGFFVFKHKLLVKFF